VVQGPASQVLRVIAVSIAARGPALAAPDGFAGILPWPGSLARYPEGIEYHSPGLRASATLGKSTYMRHILKGLHNDIPM